MVQKLVLFASLCSFWWLIKRDAACRQGVSRAIWIPTLWVGVIASRPVSMWLGVGGGSNSLEGSPADALFYFGLIAAALVTLMRRGLNWQTVMGRNWPVFLLYGYLLFSVVWAEYPLVSLKRWIKEFGNIAVLLVILTEENPQQAFRAVFVRCAYVLLPMSVVYIRYFPGLGRRYSHYSGALEPIGVTLQKNSLGALVLVCGLVLIWDWFERSRPDADGQRRWDRWLPAGMLVLGAYLLYLCDSKTSMVCLVMASGILAATRLPLLRRRVRSLGGWAVAGVVAFLVLDATFGLKEELIRSLGRDMTFTGRTDVWRELLALKTDPLLGTGFCSFWSDQRYQSKLPEEISGGRSAHSGYLETYIDGGMVAVSLLVVMLLVVGWRLNRGLASASDFAVVRFAVLVSFIIGSFSESHFGRMSPLGFLFLLSAFDPPQAARVNAEESAADGLPHMMRAHRGQDTVLPAG